MTSLTVDVHLLEDVGDGAGAGVEARVGHDGAHFQHVDRAAFVRVVHVKQLLQLCDVTKMILTSVV